MNVKWYDDYIILLSQHVGISVDRACDLLQPAVRRLGTQHGNLRCNQQLRGGVCVTVCVLSVPIGNKPVPWSSCVSDCWKWSDYRPRDAVRAIKKRVVGNKNFKEVMLALTVSVHSYLYSYHLIRHGLICHVPLTAGPGDLSEELRLQVSHPGDDTGFYRRGSGEVDHPEEQPSTYPARQSA